MKVPLFAMMSLKTVLRISILTLVTLLLVAQCLVSLRFAAEDKFKDALTSAQSTASQVRQLVTQRVNEQAVAANPKPRTTEDLKVLWQSIVSRDEVLDALLTRTLGVQNAVVDILICDDQGRILLSSSNVKNVPRSDYLSLPDLNRWKERPVWERLFEVFTEPSHDYAFVEALGVPGQTILTIRVIVSSVLLRNAIKPLVIGLAMVSFLSLLASVLVAYVFSNVLLRSLERLSQRIESIATGQSDGSPVARPAREAKEFADMQSKLDVLSQQFRGAREDVVQMRNNIERMIDRLEEGIVLFGPDGRLVRISPPAERLLGLSRDAVLDRTLEDLFPPSTQIRITIQHAINNQVAVRDAVVVIERPGASAVRVLMNVELLEDFPNHGRYSIVITVRDLETRRQLRSQLDISTRLAAISRLTGGVAHEIKNPLNAIALHIELLRARLRDSALEDGELNVIASEIARLDRVVKTFLDFTRPVELRPRDLDLADLARNVSSLVWPQAQLSRVEIHFESSVDVAMIRGDEDLIKQAVLNVVNNGIEAMKAGGDLRIALEREADDYVLSIADTGPGIPLEVRDRIFNLYFTTKQKGSGIGLAMTFRIIQLHNATIDFTSEPQHGTTFRMRFPAVDDVHSGMAAIPVQRRVQL